ncbi:prion-inhibition and propagation-domain-containing protein [Rhypophila decipiens]|uniref:Prion-inhibition and propagation-domain-containing protein n=1 Tax=Rhypophila decipiens TaxID=261697 RepID=A0AAN7B4V3_9PEZI|nr:prion-inhibition and propagation-domain-containing protein [Rhypophila decipiens]
MEVAGLAVGVVALASIFKDCIDIISNISAIRSMGRDAEVLNTKLDIEKTLFLQWAERVRLLEKNCDKRLVQGANKEAIRAVLNAICKLADESGDIQNRYGLKHAQHFDKSGPSDETTICYSRMVRFTSPFEKLNVSQKGRTASGSSPVAKIRWLAVDKEKLERLINDLSYFVSKLNDLVPPADSSKSLVSMAVEDMEQVGSFTTLRLLLSSGFTHAGGPESHLIKAAREKLYIARTFLDTAMGITTAARRPKMGRLSRMATFGVRALLSRVSGKAGCGKSTLMKHLYHHGTTKDYLSQWTGGSSLITGCFFFWYLGTPEQNTYQGLTRTLLHHILEADPSLIPQLLPDMWKDVTELESPDPSLALPIIAETQAAFERLSRTPTKVCLFIDGLDEYSGDFQEGISFIENLCQYPNLKLVVSSRPKPDFLDAFASRRMLRMQDLTKPDIERYVLDSVGGHSYLQSLMRRDETKDRAKQLLADLMDKADGIFLWIVLACRSLLKGLCRSDRIPELERRVAELPKELKAMFAYMIRKIDPRYQQHCAKLLRICHEALADKTITAGCVPTLALAFLDEYHDNLMGCRKLAQSALGPDEVEHIRTSFPVRLNSLCGGLLEIQWNVERFVPAPWNPREDPIVDTQVVFMHRSVAEFLDSDATWAMDCLYIAPGEFDARIALACFPMCMLQLSRASGNEIYTGFRFLQAANKDAPKLVLATLLDFQVVINHTEYFRTQAANYLYPHLGGGGSSSNSNTENLDIVALILAVELGLLSFIEHYVATHRRVSIANLPSRFPLLYHAIKRPFLCSITRKAFHCFGMGPEVIRYLLMTAGCHASQNIQISSSPLTRWGTTVTTTPWDIWTDGEWIARGGDGGGAQLYVQLTEAFVDSGTVDRGWAPRAVAASPDFVAAFKSNLVGFDASRAGMSDMEALDLWRRGQRILDRLFGTGAEVDGHRVVKRPRLQ